MNDERPSADDERPLICFVDGLRPKNEISGCPCEIVDPFCDNGPSASKNEHRTACRRSRDYIGNVMHSEHKNLAIRIFVLVLVFFQMGQSSDLESVNSGLNGGDPSGLYIHSEISLLEYVDVRRSSALSPTEVPVATYQMEGCINFGIGYSFSSRMIVHVNGDFSGFDRGSVHGLLIGAVGPGITWYTPLVNTFFTGNVYYSILNAEGGDPTFGNRWRLGFGKEFLFFKSYGIGMLISYERGQWDTKFPSSPKWELSGVSLNLSLTYN